MISVMLPTRFTAGICSGAIDMHVLQICHCYYPPFLDCARQYAVLFRGTGIKVTTVYLTGDADPEVEQATCSDEVIFLGYKSNEVSGLKLDAIRRIREIVQQVMWALAESIALAKGICNTTIQNLWWIYD